MALTLTTITGIIPRTDATIPIAGSVIFTLSGFDTDATGYVIPTEPVSAEIDDITGAITIDLWPNALGSRNTSYAVTIVSYLADGTRYSINVGSIFVLDSGTADLFALLDFGLPPGTTIAAYTQELLDAVAAAAASAVASAASAAASAASYDSFDDRYLGPKASDPALDNDGGALITGALYFNTTIPEMRIYNGAVWIATFATLAGGLIATNNLSDLNNPATALINLGLTATAAELNYVDGVTSSIQTTLVNTMTARADIGASADLDTYTATGFYHQNSSANAASGTNYPLPNAGMLEVLQDGNMVYQRYTDFTTGQIFTRTKYISTWYAWRNVIDNLNFVSNGVAPTASPALTGTPTAPTAAVGTSTTQLATTAFTAGALAAVGWAAQGAAIPGNDIDNIAVAGNYFIVGSTITGSPALSGMPVSSGSPLLHIQYDVSNAAQFLVNRGVGVLYVRQKGLGTWGSFRRHFDSANLLGTVSQSGGAPTGAVIEAGSNANGEFTRFADGTMICRLKAVASQSVTTANGSGFTSTTAATWTYPSTFISAPVVTGSCFSTNRWVIAVASSTTASVLQAGFQSSATTVATDVMAVGRWF